MLNDVILVVPPLLKKPIRLFGLANDPEVIAPTARSLAEVPQLYVPPAVGVPEDACATTDAEAAAHVGELVLACILQFVGKASVAPIELKSWALDGAPLVSKTCACPNSDDSEMAMPIRRCMWERTIMMGGMAVHQVPEKRRAGATDR